MIAFAISLRKMIRREKHMWEPEPEPEMRLEDYPQTHDGGVAFVRDVFASMGGTVVPPVRPKRQCSISENFMMDFENACLANHWDSSVAHHPKGDKRHLNPEWAKMIQSQVYPHHSDVDWYEYIEWVKRGGGDEYFQEEINE